ncbi:hypothetical protein Micbo1qcDRAFT_178491 [Microdochium bolleyi]|uniref:Uncharacterized protein n=1 Tax=Microdochium bolleyi TaxID=196109 RepID=A0A136ISD1_9PEZI|nr:hypothetical protein Micbo1qcDRAFT_178491 [Microdochium bolleyi]
MSPERPTDAEMLAALPMRNTHRSLVNEAEQSLHTGNNARAREIAQRLLDDPAVIGDMRAMAHHIMSYLGPAIVPRMEHLEKSIRILLYIRTRHPQPRGHPSVQIADEHLQTGFERLRRMPTFEWVHGCIVCEQD